MCRSQIFTAIGMQLPGMYLCHCDKTRPLGPIVTAVYRSWAFMQKTTVQEFLTDDGESPVLDHLSWQGGWEASVSCVRIGRV